ncbi:Hpt domain-containing protein [Winogradskyella vincentii]|uniref:Hpt domain-containing protein n=1 Tax=Winogradskyella vincentii TaxID=2877122 RepID=A0ABS7XZZ8_9FLAO|nr:Hpt domain-containing protein [Winogradskyella vincentii]MCA0152068.1 Hpt domain-containing protein [Winogradskyella vincentii]
MEQPNLSYIQSMSGGNEEFEQKLIGIIKKEFPLEKQEYRGNISAGNYKLAASNVHKLKHKISILGLERSYEVAVNYEDSLIEHKTDGQEDFEAILQIMTDFLKTL